jgi:hypothetical protein
MTKEGCIYLADLVILEEVSSGLFLTLTFSPPCPPRPYLTNSYLYASKSMRSLMLELSFYIISAEITTSSNNIKPRLWESCQINHNMCK